MITDFTMIRHGQTEANRNKILQGQVPTDLDELGRLQAQCVAERLKDEHFDRIISSDLKRAWETAEIIGKVVKAPLFADPRLREWNLGTFQGRSVAELEKEVPYVMAAFRQDGEDFPVPGGEPRSELNRRVAECIDELAEKYAGEKLLLISHGGAMRAVFRRIIGPVSGDVLLPMTSNASYSRFCKRDEVWQLCCWNDTSHLRNIGFHESVIF